MEHRDREELIKLLATQATFAPVGPEAYFRNLVLQSNLPQSFLMEVIGVYKGDPDYAARNLVLWADNKGINPQDARFTVLGSLLQPLLQKSMGLDTASFIVALIVHYSLYRDSTLLANLPVQYLSSRSVAQKEVHAAPIGPNFDWRGPNDERELQAFWQPRRVTTLDVAFIQKGIQQAASVCRVEFPDPATGTSVAIGTGFLVKQNLLLTNYHNLPPYSKYPDVHLTDLILRFGYLTSPDGKGVEGQTFKLAADPIRGSSPVDQLDYALLEIESSILESKNVCPVTLNAQRLPAKGMGINLIHHSEGQTMKLALGTNGITGIYEPEGLIQYCSETSGGASGSPCFNDDWQVVALHHAQKAGSFGVYCEGILLSEIYKEIANVL